MANTLAIETTARILPVSCIQTYKRICAGRHNTDTSNVNNPDGKEVSDHLGEMMCRANNAILSISSAGE